MVFDVHVVLLVSYLVNITELVFFIIITIYLFLLKLWIKLCAPCSSYFIKKNIDTFSIYYIFFMFITFLISILKSFVLCVSAGSVYFGN